MAHSRFQHLCTRTTIDGAARSQGVNGWRCLISAVPALGLGSLSAQLGAECHTPDEATETEQGGPLLCSVPTDWTFDDGQDYQNWPILVHRAWFHFIRPTDGGGIHAGDQEAAAAAAMASVNNRFSALSNPTLPVVTSPPIPVFPDSRIRFELKGISYHDVGVISSFAPNRGVTSNLFNSQYGIEQPFIINVYFFTNLDPNSGTAGGFASSGPQAFACAPERGATYLFRPGSGHADPGKQLC